MGALDGFQVEVENPSCWVGPHGGIAGVGERAGLAIAEASDIVGVAAEVLLFSCSGVEAMSAVEGRVICSLRGSEGCRGEGTVALT